MHHVNVSGGEKEVESVARKTGQDKIKLNSMV
jgi:hypothetical protein